ncbi:MAG: hypothetical protein ABR505_02505 [Actinomycetota bacterium]
MKPSWMARVLAMTVTISACAKATEPRSAASVRAGDQVEVSRSLLSDADEAARRYGRDHLGHFLKLKRRHLVGEAVTVPDGLSVDVQGGHTSYCITVLNRALPSIHPWRVATTGSGSVGASSTDRCSS